MESKYQTLFSLYDLTSKKIVENKENWKDFLKSASNNYKLSFIEQIMVYAQRPDATAVLEIHKWSKLFDRWVNKGAKGIQVLTPKNDESSDYKVKYYFDISDTHPGNNAQEVPIWKMESVHESFVKSALAQIYELDTDNADLKDVISRFTESAIEENIEAYFEEFKNTVTDSLLEELDEDNLKMALKETAIETASYIIDSRLGIESKDDEYDFKWVSSFNKQDCLIFCSDMANEVAVTGLKEIATAINKYEVLRRKENVRTQEIHGRNDLHRSGRDSLSEHRIPKTGELPSGTLGEEKSEISERKRADNILSDDNGGNSTSASERSGRISRGDDGIVSSGNEEERGNNTRPETERHDEMGGSDEQHQSLRQRDSDERTDLQLEYHDEKTEDKSLPFFIVRADMFHRVLTRDELTAIKEFYENHHNEKERIKYLQNLFLDDKNNRDDRLSFNVYSNVLHIKEESADDTPAKQFWYHWRVIAKYL